MSHGSFMSHLQTRSGLEIIRDNYMAACEVAPWANKELVESTLLEESDVLMPVFSIRYNWITAGGVLCILNFLMIYL